MNVDETTLPFDRYDREAGYRTAWPALQRRLEQPPPDGTTTPERHP